MKHHLRDTAVIAATSFIAGLALFYAVDRFRFLWNANVREMRHAGWAAQQKAT